MTVFFGSTHPGKSRSHNEDVIGWDTERNVWLVADGMGGHAHGEVASRLVKEVVFEGIAEGSDLADSILDAHETIVRSASENNAYEGMGSTVVALQISREDARVVWVGDSRAYLWRDEKLTVLTRDHSYLELMLAAGHITEEEARNHPKRNVVTQILGVGEARPDEDVVSLRQGDWFVLCSDGLNDELTDVEIASQLRSSKDTEVAVKHLIEGALTQGGRDNVSVIVVQCDDKGTPRAPAGEDSDKNVVLPILLGGAAAALSALVLWWMK